jgi:hypothetical protein
VLVRLQFVRPRGQEQEGDLYDSIDYGPVSYLMPAEQQVVAEQPPIPPGQSVDITLDDRAYESLLPTLHELNYPVGIKRVKVLIGELDYSDGTKWSTDKLFKRDPKNPKKWIRLENPKGSARANRSSSMNSAHRSRFLY